MAIKRDYQPPEKPKKRKPVAGAEGWTHAGLIRDLCAQIDTSNDYICSEVYAGSRFLERRPVPDALRIRMSYTRPDFAIYEIKVSRADFLADIRTDKWQTYLPYCSRFYFATPEHGVATADDIPFVAGWMVRGENGWRTCKTPAVRPFEPDYHYALALLISEQKHRWAAERRDQRNKKLAHTPNVEWSEHMAARVHKYEEGMKELSGIRHKLIHAKAALKKHFGIDMQNYWAWDGVANRLGEMKQGLSQENARNLRYHIDNLNKIVNEVAPPELDKAG